MMSQLQLQLEVTSRYREDSVSFLHLINVWWTISNSRKGDYKIDFLNAMADWLEEWSMCPNFVFSKQTINAMITTLRGWTDS